MDSKITVQELRNEVIRFRDERNWRQFHDPKNLSIGLSVECAELEELFLWKNEEEVRQFLNGEKGRSRVGEELADIFVFLLYLSEACGVDLSDEVKKKIRINEQKYPVEKSYDSHTKYDELE